MYRIVRNLGMSGGEPRQQINILEAMAAAGMRNEFTIE